MSAVTQNNTAHQGSLREAFRAHPGTAEDDDGRVFGSCKACGGVASLSPDDQIKCKAGCSHADSEAAWLDWYRDFERSCARPSENGKRRGSTNSGIPGATNGAAPAGPPVAAPETGEVLGMVHSLIEKYVVLPSEHEATALALFVAHTWAIEGAHATPYLLVVSPERRSGKTRLLEVLELLVRTPWRIASASEAAMFRKINDHKPTLLLDEIDAIFGSATERTEPLRAVLNAGNRPGSAVARCVGEGAKQAVVDFSVYCPKVLAGIDTGRVPDTILDRSIRLAMKRRTAAEPAAALRHRHADREARPVRDGLEVWGAANAPGLLEAEPANIPAGLDDRAAEAWEPLFAIADLAGGKTPAQARSAAAALIGDDADEPGHGARLLAALRTVFADQAALATTAILEAVNSDDELPFGGWRHGDGLDGRGLARLLKPYAIKPRTIRLGETTAKGYRRDQLEEVWDRYLPPTPQKASHGEHRSQPAPHLERDVTLVTDVTANPEREATATCTCRRPARSPRADGPDRCHNCQRPMAPLEAVS